MEILRDTLRNLGETYCDPGHSYISTDFVIAAIAIRLIVYVSTPLDGALKLKCINVVSCLICRSLVPRIYPQKLNNWWSGRLRG